MRDGVSTAGQDAGQGRQDAFSVQCSAFTPVQHGIGETCTEEADEAGQVRKPFEAGLDKMHSAFSLQRSHQCNKAYVRHAQREAGQVLTILRAPWTRFDVAYSFRAGVTHVNIGKQV